MLVLASLLLALLLIPTLVLAFCRPDTAWVVVAERWGLQAPDGQRTIWSGSGGFAIMEVLSSDPVSSLPSGGFSGGGSVRFHRFCPIDWSADSRYLLTTDASNVVAADQYERVVYGTLKQGQLPRRPVDLEPLGEAIERYWLLSGRSISEGGGYYLEALGWEAAGVNRIVFQAVRRFYGLGSDPVARFLGYWSVEIDGRDPRLLADRLNGFVLTRFGRYLGVLPSLPSGFGHGGGPPVKR
jgi:hypothetical protein